ncbi:unnamed protein product [Clonostachys rosea]|uniref:Major facilitator superfamily (MFS) profile domain-containing protein n=1 Tax=Bionectria ochroleuca TaxID=29856 RepID=A0ABY6TZT7_BIOOC|nr:unnamed protein product [Clonostachys rosea]
MLQLARLGPVPGYTLAVLSASFAISILAYDASLINNLNILPQYIEHFQLDSSLIGLNTAIVSAGSIVAGPLVGPLIDRWGRKTGLMISSVLVALGAILQVTSQTEVQFVIGRFFIGMASTISGTTAPMWVMELASPRLKNLLTGICVTSLPFAGVIVTAITMGIHNSGSAWGWKGPIMGELVIGIVPLLLLPFTDESPRWLIYQGYHSEALEVLNRLYKNGHREDQLVSSMYKEISDTLEFEKQHDGGWKSLIYPAANLRRFSIAVLCNIFYQVVGAQMILYFFTFIVQQAGITDTMTTLIITLGLGIWASIWVSIGGYTVNRVGQRKALVWATAFMTVCFILLGVLVYLTESRDDTRYSIGAIVVIFFFQIASCSTWFNVAYIYPPQILKYTQRGKGVAAAQAIGFALSFLNLYTTPIAIANISWRYYIANAAWDAVMILIIQWFFVNTDGKSLEEIDEIFDGLVHTNGVVVNDVENDTSGDSKMNMEQKEVKIVSQA